MSRKDKKLLKTPLAPLPSDTRHSNKIPIIIRTQIVTRMHNKDNVFAFVNRTSSIR